MKIFDINGIEIKERGFDLQPINLKRSYKMSALFNWKTTLIGLLIFAVKAIEGTGIISPDVTLWLITALTGLLGLFSADSKKV